MSTGLHLFGIRHLSPAGAWHLRCLLDRVQPELILVEGPCDMDALLADLVRPETKPPVAVLAYTKHSPMRSILYPLAEYSPEYQAIVWAHTHQVPCRFIDLPARLFLAMPEILAEREVKETPSPSEDVASDENVLQAEEEQAKAQKWAELEADGYESFWERTLEHAAEIEGYQQGAIAFGTNLRHLDQARSQSTGRVQARIEGRLREAYMRRCIEEAMRVTAPEKIVVIVGAYHVLGLQNIEPMTDQELASLESLDVACTLMPYSYYRLSSRSGYGAGNKAPAYYSLLWQGLVQNDMWLPTHRYLSLIARALRQDGYMVSSAQIIDAVRLASALASLRGSVIPALPDLRDSALTCLANGSLACLSKALVAVEIGTSIGSLPAMVSRTSVQEDFYNQVHALKLDRYLSQIEQELRLDLREKRTVKSERSAFLDLNRSFFLQRLRVLGVSFATLLPQTQQNATWAEQWSLQWTPESEIELVECALKGDTLAQAVAYELQERLKAKTTTEQIATLIEDAFACGLESELMQATKALQALTVDAVNVSDLAKTAEHLANVLRYNDLRRLDLQPLRPLLAQIFLRCTLLFTDACLCDEQGAQAILEATDRINRVQLLFPADLDEQYWLNALVRVAQSDLVNARLAGFATAILLERGTIDNAALQQQISLRLSPGTKATIGAGWFAGLALRNRHALLARVSLWQSLSAYIDSLDDESFKRALLFLRRAFGDFTAAEKDAIAENLGEIWGLNSRQVSEVVNTELSADSQKAVAELSDFDFSDF